MKYFNIAIASLVLALATPSVFGQYEVDFDDGSTSYYEALCWYIDHASVSTSQPIEGNRSIRTDKLNSNIGTIISPWVLLSGSGNLTFKHRIYSFNGSRNLKVYLLSEANPSGELILNYDYSNGTTQTESIAITQSGLYQVKWVLSGSGGNSRGQLDLVSIPGTYASDPSSDCDPININPDTDGDGVPDSEDDYPADQYRAYNNYYPASGQATLAFEDLWPSDGDYDLNDVVVGYSFKIVTDADDDVVDLFGTFVLKASGAGLHNGFGFELPTVAPASVISTTGYDVLPSAGYSFGSNGLESGQTNATVIVFDDFFRITPPAPSTFGVNTWPTQQAVPYDTLTVTMVFMNNGTPGAGGAVSLTALNIAEFNPFIVAGMIRGMEVHLPDYPPTDLADPQYFGTIDDDSNPATGKYYKTAANLPWALNIYEVFDYPVEQVPITNAYLKFSDWVQSNGILFPNWYQNIAGYRNAANIY
ncbi:MAG: LruC domain-containing protein [Bacteroidales bacterium]|nr:LruC domain-containing protein [Bacteroidales bacterium]